ncbi:MAG: hypothetical protein P8178_15970 [Candidatus Thiodiazotropha sp.]
MCLRRTIPIALCVLLSTCAKSPAPGDFFPLGSGLSWRYEVTRVFKSRIEHAAFSEVNLERVEYGGHQATVRRTGEDNHYYVTRRGDGIYRVAKRNVAQSAPHQDKEPRLILPLPPRVGATWSNHSQPYALRRIHPYEDSLTRGVGFDMTYQLVANDDSVEVPAGRFEHCLRVEGSAQLSIYSDARRGYQEIPIRTTEWYAPGVGLVKLVREEPLDTDVFQGGTITLALSEFDY